MTRLTILAALLLGGCGFTPQGDLARELIATKGKEAAAQSLANIEWGMCRAAPVGAIRDRYGKDQATADAWRTLCDGQDGVDLIGPVE